MIVFNLRHIYKNTKIRFKKKHFWMKWNPNHLAVNTVTAFTPTYFALHFRESRNKNSHFHTHCNKRFVLSERLYCTVCQC